MADRARPGDAGHVTFRDGGASGASSRDGEFSPAAALPWPAILAAGTGSVTVGFLPLAARRLYADGLTPFSLLFWRYAIAIVAIAVLARLAGLPITRGLRRGGWRLVLVGATLGTAQTLCYFESLRWIDTGIAILLFYTYPAMTLALERVVFRRRVRPRAALCIALVVSGAALVCGPGVRSGAIDPRGLAWALPGPVVYAVYLAINARLMRGQPPLLGAGFLYLGFLATFLAAVVLFGLQVPGSATNWAILAFIALGAGVLSATCFSYSVPRLGPSSYAIIANCELITVVAIGVLVLGEVLTPTRAVGGAMIAAGILLHGLFGRAA